MLADESWEVWSFQIKICQSILCVQSSEVQGLFADTYVHVGKYAYIKSNLKFIWVNEMDSMITWNSTVRE